MSPRARGHRLLAAATSLLAAPCAHALALAQSTPALARPAAHLVAPACGTRDGAVARTWPAPLDRVVALRARDLSLRDALDRLAAAARVRLSYSAELLPLERRVCIDHGAVSLGDALAELLRGVAVQPVVAGADQVVLAPGRTSAAPMDSAPTPPMRVSVLDRVVVTGSAAGGAERALPIAVDVLRGAQLEARNVGTLSTILDGSVPGLWMWTQAPSSLLARYGSIRGASSFGTSYPKVYVDGIELANPLLLTQMSTESIERVEVIRGPQGAALYGADAISGVVNIVLRHDGTQAGAPRARLRTSAGVAESDFASSPAVAQSHALSLHAGSGVRAATLAVAGGSDGAYMPGAFARQLSASGGVRLVGARRGLTGTARLFAARAGAPVSPLVSEASMPSSSLASSLADSTMYGAPPREAGGSQSLVAYTVGTTLFAQSARWTHTVVAGVDGYRLNGVPDESLLVPGDPSVETASGAADRGTLRVSTVAHVGEDGATTGTLTFAAEQSVLRERAADGGTEGEEPYATSYVESAPSWRGNTGLVAQANAAFRDALYLTGGVRFERDAGASDFAHSATLPMVGVAWVQDRGGASVKLRAAYGKGIRSPRTSARLTTQPGMRLQVLDASLAPEQQSGIEAGIDLTVGRRLMLQATRFDQLASGLIQRVVLAADAGEPRETPEHRLRYRLQNVGEIANRGWELQASATGGPLALSGALSLVDSRVRRTAANYAGDLRPGDRMLEVPARTASLTAAWSYGAARLSVSAIHAADWINYDRVALARAVADGVVTDAMGARLRGYWKRYDGVTRLRATASQPVYRGVALLLTGENLLGTQRGEPDNATVLPGRMITAGIRVDF